MIKYIVLFWTLSSALFTNDNLCEQKGGVIYKGGCLCEETNNYIDPQNEICLFMAMHLLSVIQSSTEQTNPCSSEQPITQPENIVHEDELCSNPAKYFCNSSLNQNIDENIEASNQFKKEEEKAENSSRVKSFIKKKSNNDAEDCFDLDNNDYIECVKIRNEELSKNIYTKDRKEKAQFLFEKAKTALKKTLEHKYNLLSSKDQEPSKKVLKKMISQIDEAKIFFGSLGSHSKGTSIQYDASAKSQVHETEWIEEEEEEKEWSFTDLFKKKPKVNNYRNTVYLEGRILAVDKNPESIYQTLLHELSHFIDPGAFHSFHDNFEEYPFSKEIKCLRREDSAHAKPYDIQCLKDRSQKYRSEKPDISDSIDVRLEIIQDEPMSSWSFPRPSFEDHYCQEEQINEAFSDWLATEAFQHENEARNVSKEDILNQDGFIDLNELMQSIPKTMESFSHYCPGLDDQKSEHEDSHPHSSDRLNAIMLAHPSIRTLIGCKLNNIRKYNIPSHKEEKVYCGSDLYQDN